MVPLLSDASENTDTFLAFQSTQVIEMKGLILSKGSIGLEGVREKMRQKLVAAIKNGQVKCAAGGGPARVCDAFSVRAQVAPFDLWEGQIKVLSSHLRPVHSALLICLLVSVCQRPSLPASASPPPSFPL